MNPTCATLPSHKAINVALKIHIPQRLVSEICVRRSSHECANKILSSCWKPKLNNCCLPGSWNNFAPIFFFLRCLWGAELCWSRLWFRPHETFGPFPPPPNRCYPWCTAVAKYRPRSWPLCPNLHSWHFTSSTRSLRYQDLCWTVGIGQSLRGKVFFGQFHNERKELSLFSRALLLARSDSTSHSAISSSSLSVHGRTPPYIELTTPLPPSQLNIAELKRLHLICDSRMDRL